MIDCDKVKMLTNLVVNRSLIKDHATTTTKIKALYGNNANNLATSLIHYSLFLENQSLIVEISRDSWKIYSYIGSHPKNGHFNDFSEGLLDESLVKLSKTQPMKSYLRLSLRQVMKFITSRCKSYHLIDVPYLMSYMNELRSSFETMCAEDRIALKSSRDGFGAINNFINDANLNASFLIGWTLIEGAKHCICNKFAPDMSASEFLTLLQKEILTPVAFGDKITRQFLLNFLQNLDKLILDRISDSSTGKHTFTVPSNIDHFYKANCPIFKSWLLKNRQNMAKLSLRIDNPAECWRNINIKLCSDLATKYQASNSPNRDPSLSQTLMSLNTKNWYSNLSLLASSAKQLEDIALLHGIKALADFGGIICEYPPLVYMLSNLEGQYENTYDLLKDSRDLDQQSLIEFLNACDELNLLEENQHHIEQLESGPFKTNYERYVRSKSRKTSQKYSVEEIEKWLNTWSDLSEFNGDGRIDQPIGSCIDLVVPACLNMIVKIPNNDDGEKMKLFERTEWLISQDFIAQSLMEPSHHNKNVKIYHVLLNLLKGNQGIDERLLEIHAKDLYWNHSLFRHLSDLNLITNLRTKRDNTIDLVQFRAAKYNRRHNNVKLATRIAQDLAKNANSSEIKIRSSLLLVQDCDTEKNCDTLLELANQIKELEDLQDKQRIKDELHSKVLRCILRTPSTKQIDNELKLYKNIVDQDFDSSTGCAEAEVTTYERWQHLFESTSSISFCRTMLLFSRRANDQLELSPDDDKLLNYTFSLELSLLKGLCKSGDLPKYKAAALECGARILKQIMENSSHLSKDNLIEFKSANFIVNTTSLWIILKTNLISVITYKEDLETIWKEALVNVVKHIGQLYPNLLIYSVIVNRLDLQNELVYLNDDDGKLSAQDPCSILLAQTVSSDIPIQEEQPSSGGKLKDCKRKLAFWNELFDHIIQFEPKWRDIFVETERFVKEIRKISFLCGEYLKTLTVKIPKKLFNFMDHFRKYCDTRSGLINNAQRQDECYKRLKTTCQQALNPIKALLSYSKKIGEANLSKYDIWFCETFGKHLLELEYRLNLLAKKKPMVLDELTMLIKAITELLAVCRNILLEYNHISRQKLYMEMISPLLSRLEPSLIPMPDCCNEPSLDAKKSFISIHKISQTVNLIVSKTSPKKLKFIGSDGISRSFLLKAHEDLRLDQLIMDLFSSINNLFLGNSDTRDKFRLRRYSVVPVSTRSGLIQWIEAPSLCSSYRSWLNGPNGKEVIEELYSTTCDVLCDEQQSSTKPKSSHLHCQPPRNVKSADIFYQLLWAKTKSSKVPLTQTKPFFGNIIKYRSEFDPSVFQSIIEQLLIRMPQDLFSNQLWYSSHNSHSYWLKTQEFIRSCAAMSIVGYAFGLGDRHLENILLDHGTGEVIHIDYNVCFEFGKTLSIPEQVPFRLTQNMIHAFGFAGLEGGFSLSCRSVLNALKGYKSTLLHLLDPINLKFMVGQQSCGKTAEDSRDPPQAATRIDFHNRLPLGEPIIDPKLPLSTLKATTSALKLQPLEMEMCSQESVELVKSPAPDASDVTDLLILNPHNHGQANTSGNCITITSAKTIVTNSKPTQPYHSFDFQHNIKTPTKILEKTATNIHERFRDKLSGTDEFLRHYKKFSPYDEDVNGDPVKPLSANGGDVSGRMQNVDEQNIDLIMLNDAQTTEDQVEALIMEATSIKNKAAMFEGWVPWI